MDFMSDGALYGEYAEARHRHHEARMKLVEGKSVHDMGATAKDVGVLALASTATAFSLSALASYRHKQDPKVGMPSFGIGLDSFVGIAGLATAILAGPALGEVGELIALGVGLGGVNTAAVFYGGGAGAYMAQPRSVAGTGTTVGAAGKKQMPQHTAMSDVAKETLRSYGIKQAA